MIRSAFAVVFVSYLFLVTAESRAGGDSYWKYELKDPKTGQWYQIGVEHLSGTGDAARLEPVDCTFFAPGIKLPTQTTDARFDGKTLQFKEIYPASPELGGNQAKPTIINCTLIADAAGQLIGIQSTDGKPKGDIRLEPLPDAKAVRDEVQFVADQIPHMIAVNQRHLAALRNMRDLWQQYRAAELKEGLSETGSLAASFYLHTSAGVNQVEANVAQLPLTQAAVKQTLAQLPPVDGAAAGNAPRPIPGRASVDPRLKREYWKYLLKSPRDKDFRYTGIAEIDTAGVECQVVPLEFTFLDPNIGLPQQTTDAHFDGRSLRFKEIYPATPSSGKEMVAECAFTADATGTLVGSQAVDGKPVAELRFERIGDRRALRKELQDTLETLPKAAAGDEGAILSLRENYIRTQRDLAAERLRNAGDTSYSARQMDLLAKSNLDRCEGHLSKLLLGMIKFTDAIEELDLEAAKGPAVTSH